MLVPLATTTRAVIVTLVLALTMFIGAKPASAHTAFDTSSPADGEVIEGPLSEITVTFSGEATPAGEGFVVLDPSGTIRTPDAISTVDNLTWTLGFDQPLESGEAGVRWMVAAPDAHPIEGSFSFIIVTPVPSEVEVEPAEAGGSAVGGEAPEPSPEVEVLSNSVTAEAEVATDLDSFLETDDNRAPAVGLISTAARIVSILGAVLAIGGAAFAAFGLRGDPTDVQAVLRWVRRGGALLVIGAIAEAVAVTAALAGDWTALTSPSQLSAALWSSAGVAVALRAVGGLFVLTKTNFETTIASAAGDPVVAARQLAFVGAGHAAPPADRSHDEPFVYADDHAWNQNVAVVGLGGVLLVAASFMFDGHTASEGPRWLHAFANVIHVSAASIWAGGVAMLALVISRRNRKGRPTQALQLAMRFSVIATAALVAAGVVGVGLSVIVLDSITDIWSTSWGRLLALKLVLVAAAAVGGAYNHRVIVPALSRTPDHQPTIDRFRSVVTFEAAALIAVAIVTAFLIGASAV